MCKDRIPRVRFASKKEPAPGVSVKRDPSGKSFFVSILVGHLHLPSCVDRKHQLRFVYTHVQSADPSLNKIFL